MFKFSFSPCLLVFLGVLYAQVTLAVLSLLVVLYHQVGLEFQQLHLLLAYLYPQETLADQPFHQGHLFHLALLIPLHHFYQEAQGHLKIAR